MKDPFDVLGVEKRFDLDAKALADRHKDLAKTLHPDRYAKKSSDERRMALGRAIEVNEAFRLLKNPVRRAEALARSMGLAVGETEEPKADPTLLMEMMELREELADATRARDRNRVEKLARDMRERERETLAKVESAFRSAPQHVVSLLGELRYLSRFLDEVAAFEDALFAEPLDPKPSTNRASN